MSTPAPRGPLFRFDAGWLYLIAGSAVIVAAVLIPAIDDLAEARFHRDSAIAYEQYRAERLKNYSDYLDALNDRSPTLVLSLAAVSLNLAPEGKSPLYRTPEPWAMDASVFADLEPTLRRPKAPVTPDSILHRWATGTTTSLWLSMAGILCILFGLLPPAQAGRSRTGTLRSALQARREQRAAELELADADTDEPDSDPLGLADAEPEEVDDAEGHEPCDEYDSEGDELADEDDVDRVIAELAADDGIEDAEEEEEEEEELEYDEDDEIETDELDDAAAASAQDHDAQPGTPRLPTPELKPSAPQPSLFEGMDRA